MGQMLCTRDPPVPLPQTHRPPAPTRPGHVLPGGKTSWVGMLLVSQAACCSGVAGPAPTRWVLSPVPWKESHSQGQRDFRASLP